MMTYLGHLPWSDPLFNYLKYEIQPQLGDNSRTDYRVFRLNGSNAVYLYEDVATGSRVIGKFFQHPGSWNDAAEKRMEREWRNLDFVRSQGFDGKDGPHYVARALGINPGLNSLLVEECCDGEALSAIILRAIFKQDNDLLYRKLTALAWFLAKLHNRTADFNQRINFDATHKYCEGLIGALRSENLFGSRTTGRLMALANTWRQQGKMYSDASVVVHGDATPENFIFGDGDYVISFDLERLGRTDRLFDVGRLAGELAHFFYMEGGDRMRAEPFIGHFLWEYACHFPDREQTFASITARLPYYMGITLLRIARNPYLWWDYRRCLIHEAEVILSGGLS